MPVSKFIPMVAGITLIVNGVLIVFGVPAQVVCTVGYIAEKTAQATGLE